jgi:glycosyltransferase involved in cell wall biosynthesis
MASGLPVVAFDAEGVRDLVRHGETGLLAPPGNEAAFAQALKDLLAAPEQRALLGTRARHAAEQRTWESVMNGLLRVYQQVALGDEAAQAA